MLTSKHINSNTYYSSGEIMIMKSNRDISLNIGKSVYTINTSLDNESIDRVKALIDEACGEISKGTNQEDLLMLACLRLGYSLDTVSQKLNALLSSINYRPDMP